MPCLDEMPAKISGYLCTLIFIQWTASSRLCRQFIIFGVVVCLDVSFVCLLSDQITNEIYVDGPCWVIMHDSSSSLFLYIHSLSSVTIVLAYRLSLAELFLHSSLNSPRIQCYFVSPVPLEVLNHFNIFLRSKFTGLILLHQICWGLDVGLMCMVCLFWFCRVVRMENNTGMSVFKNIIKNTTKLFAFIFGKFLRPNIFHGFVSWFLLQSRSYPSWLVGLPLKLTITFVSAGYLYYVRVSHYTFITLDTDNSASRKFYCFGFPSESASLI